MKISYSSDIIEDSGISPLVSDHSLSTFFRTKDYGNSEVSLFFVINCLDFAAKNRVRFSSIDRVLYWDVILNYDEIKAAPLHEKKSMLANSIINSFDVLDKYRKLKIDKVAIKADARKHYQKIGWL